MPKTKPPRNDHRERRDKIWLKGKVYVSSNVVAQETGYSEYHIREMARGKRIAQCPGVVKIKSRWFYDLDVIKAYLGVVHSDSRRSEPSDEDILNDPGIGI